MEHDDLDALIAERAAEEPNMYALIEGERTARAAARETGQRPAPQHAAPDTTDARTRLDTRRTLPQLKQRTSRVIERLAQRQGS